ncbi:MAG: hypothetical protein NTW31_06910 [Bacteroidetes bacterium]|nr:hypothetical protein [Bacteroidota bacterium]
MDKSIITRELQILLEAINEQFEIIREYDDFIPQIEFDMIMENVRKLYETFHRLQRLNDPLLFVEKKISGPRDFKISVAHPPEPLIEAREIEVSQPLIKAREEAFQEPLIKDREEESQEPLIEAREEEFQEPLIEAGEETAREPLKETPLPTSIRMKPVVKKESSSKRPVKASELELFAAEEPVFNIKLKEAREKSLGPKIPRNESFKASIGINDKFLFINELFDGNLREYNESIETLSGFKTLPQAQEYLDLLRRRNNWNSASNAFKRIKELVEKRY